MRGFVGKEICERFGLNPAVEHDITPDMLAAAKEERESAKAVQQKRWDARRDALRASGELKPGETLEEYDTRKAKGK